MNLFVESLKVMGVGMLGIFFEVILLILIIWLLKKIFPAKEDFQEEKYDE